MKGEIQTNGQTDREKEAKQNRTKQYKSETKQNKTKQYKINKRNTTQQTKQKQSKAKQIQRQNKAKQTKVKKRKSKEQSKQHLNKGRKEGGRRQRGGGGRRRRGRGRRRKRRDPNLISSCHCICIYHTTLLTFVHLSSACLSCLFVRLSVSLSVLPVSILCYPHVPVLHYPSLFFCAGHV